LSYLAILPLQEQATDNQHFRPNLIHFKANAKR